MEHDRSKDPLKDKLAPIQRNVPLPDSQWRAPTKYPVPDMRVGDSFFVETRDTKHQLSIRSTINSYQRRYGMKLTCRKVKEKRKIGLRIWRIE